MTTETASTSTSDNAIVSSPAKTTTMSRQEENIEHAAVSASGEGGDKDGNKVVRSAPRRSYSTSSKSSRRGDGGVDEAVLLRLQTEMNEMSVKHREELYWLKLELDTTRREKEAVEDRMAELYRDMQELHEENKPPPGGAGRGSSNDMKQVQKYEKMVRILNNQIQLVRSSCDKVVKSLKDEISDLMDEKSRSEVNLMNRLSDLDKENRELKSQLEIIQQTQKDTATSKVGGKTKAPIAMTTLGRSSSSPVTLNGRIMMTGTSSSSSTASSTSNPAEMTALRTEIKQLKSENQRLLDELSKERIQSQSTIEHMSLEMENLGQQVDTLQNELLVARSASEAIKALDRMRQDHEESVTTLDRVSMMWNRVDESIRTIESIANEFQFQQHENDVENNKFHDFSDNNATEEEDRERILTTLETIALLHGQVKVALMLIELKLQNNLACFRNDRNQLVGTGTTTATGVMTDEDIVQRMTVIKKDALEAIDRVQTLFEEEVAKLEEKASNESEIVKETIETKIGALQLMESRQTLLEEEIFILQDGEMVLAKDESVSNVDESDMFVSRRVLEQLQNEVLQVVEQVKQKNEIIGRLEATTEEHQVRERALMEELKRLMDESAAAEAAQRQRRIDAQAARDAEEGSEPTDEDFVDYSSDEFNAEEFGGEEDDDEAEEEYEEIIEEIIEEEVIEDE